MQRDMVVKLTITGDGKIAVQAVDQVAGAQKRLDDQQKKSAQGTKEATGAAEQYIEALRKQLRELQSNQAALRESEAISRGATKQQLEDIRALGTAIDNHGQKTGRLAQLTGSLGSIMGVAARASVAFAAALALAAPVSALSQAQDEARVLLARITGITGSLGESRQVYAGLISDAIRLRVGLTDTLEGYTRIAGAVKELGGSAKQARELNEIIIATAKTSGASAQEATAAARQFAQALGSGVLQGDELKSILENNQELARQLARGLKVSVGELRTLGEQGKLTADVVARALLGQLPEIRAKLADVPLTASDAWTKLSTTMSSWLVAGDKVEMKAGLIARAMNAIADGIARANAEASKPLASPAVPGAVSETPGGAGFVGPTVGSAGARNRERQAALADYAAEVERLARDRGLADVALGLAQAVKKSLDDLTKDFEKNASAFEKTGIEISRSIGFFNAAEAAIRAVRDANASQGKDTSREDAELSRLAQRRAELVARIPLEVAEANKKTWDEFEKQARIGVDKQAEQYDRWRDAALKTNEVILAGYAGQAAALEAQREQNTISQADYVAKRQELQAKEAAVLAANIETERTNAEERAKLYRGIVEQVRARFGDEAAAASDAQKQVVDAQLKLLDVSKKRVDQNTKQAQSTAALVKIEVDGGREIAKAADAFREAMQKLADSYEAAAIARAETLEQERFELTLLGMDEVARQKAIAIRRIDIETRKQLTAAEKAYQEAFKTAVDEADVARAQEARNRERAQILANAAAQKQVTAEVIETGRQVEASKSFWDGLFNSIKGGWKGVRDYVKNFFFDWLIQQLKQQFILNIGYNLQGSGGIGGMLSGLFGGGSSGGGIGGLLGSLFGGGSGGGLFGSIAGGTGLLGGLGSLLGIGTGGGLLGAIGLGGFGAGLGGAASLAGSTALSLGVPGAAFGAQLASFIPVIGPMIAIAAALLPSLLKNNSGLWFDINGKVPGGHPENQFTTALGSTIQLHGEGNISDAKPYVAQFQNLAQNFVTIFGKEVAERASAVVNQYWTGYSERGRGTEYTNATEYAAALAKEGKDVLAEYFSKAFSVVDQRIADTISAWTGSTEDLVKYIQTVLSVQSSINNQASLLTSIIGSSITLKDILDLQKEGEALSDTFSRILGTFSITNTIAQALGKGADAFGAVGLASLEARERVVSLAGGIQALGSDVQGYLDKFFSADERAAMQRELARKQVDAAFAELNLSVPASREAFRALVSSLDLSTESGQRTFVALMKINGAFDLMIGTSEQAGEGIYTIIRYTRNFGEAAVTAAALIEQAAQQIAGIGTTEAMEQGTASAQARLKRFFDIIDSAGEASETKLQRKMTAAQSVLAQLQAEYQDLFTRTGGQTGAEGLALQTAIGAVQGTIGSLANDLARLTILRAQYGDKADALLELEHWYTEQRGLAAGNAELLLVIEQSYQTRRNAILAGGVASGLSQLSATLQDWLNGLLLNQQLTTLTPEQQLIEARRQYEAALASGDASAITRAADAYLASARSFFASGEGYQLIYAAVTGQIRTLIAGGTVTPTTVTTGAYQSPSGTPNTVATAAGAATSLTGAIEQANSVLAEIMGRTKYAIEGEGAATRNAAAENTRQLVAAIDNAGLQRAAV